MFLLAEAISEIEVVTMSMIDTDPHHSELLMPALALADVDLAMALINASHLR